MIISALTFPGGPGKFMSADVNTHDQIHALFANYTWAQVTLQLSFNIPLASNISVLKCIFLHSLATDAFQNWGVQRWLRWQKIQLNSENDLLMQG